MAKTTLKMRKEAMATLLATMLNAEEITPANAEKITGVLGASVSAQPKRDEEGNVWCSYFGVYLPETEFNVNSKGKIDSMSKAGKQLHRAQRSAVNKANNGIISQFRSEEISASEMSELLNDVEKNASYKYPQGTDDIPEDYPFEV